MKPDWPAADRLDQLRAAKRPLPPLSAETTVTYSLPGAMPEGTLSSTTSLMPDERQRL